MARSLRVEAPIRAVGKARPRLGRGGRVYTPKASRDFERMLAAWARVDCGSERPLDGALEVEIRVMVAPPVSWSRRKRVAAVEGASPAPGKPDLDNIVKAVLDGLTGVMWHDDRQIARIVAARTWARADRVVVTAREIGDD